MIEILYILILFLIPTLILGIIVFLSFWIPKKLGYKRAGNIIGSLVSLFFTYMIFSMIFEDELFSKNDAKELLKEQEIYLNDDFKLEENSSTWAIGDYYHTFTLSISENDKVRLIKEIKGLPNFKDSTTQITSLLYSTEDKPIGQKIWQNYETKVSFNREFYEEHGENYAPTFRTISISKTENKLTFEEIDL